MTTPRIRLTRQQTALIESRGRTLVQPPTEADAKVVREIQLHRPVAAGKLPFDVVFTLEALRHLADQGNAVAKDLYDYETRRLGLR